MTIRLAFGNSPPERNGTSGLERTRAMKNKSNEEQEAAPTVRLAVCPAESGSGKPTPNTVEHHVDRGGLGHSPTVRLVAQTAADYHPAIGGALGAEAALDVSGSEAPALLVSYFYLEPFIKNQPRYRYRDWSLDSGAFSAHNSGQKIDLNAYIDCCLQLVEQDKTLTEVFALDVIGDPDKSFENTQEMWRQGVAAIPCFHCGEPEELLYQMAKDYPKIALGGMVSGDGGILGATDKLGWLQQCFARVWPKKIHGFGVAGSAIVLGLPFHSVDATNWEIAPTAFGNWQKFGQMSVRGSNQDLRSQVKHYLDLEAKARIRWKKEMALLGTLPATAPTVRLDGEPHSGRGENNFTGANRKPLAFVSATKPVARKSTQTEAMDDKWVDYWKNRKM